MVTVSMDFGKFGAVYRLYDARTREHREPMLNNAAVSALVRPHTA